MKKILVAASLAFFSFVANAQRTTFGLKGGLNLSTVKTDDSEFNEERKMRPTFHFGPVLNIGVSNNFSIQPQLLLQGKGVGIEHDGHTDKFSFLSLDLPVNLLYRSNGFFIGGCPNLGINLSGKLKAEDDPSENTDFTFGEGGQYKRTNVGLNFLTGYQLRNGLSIQASYLAGLSNWKSTTNDTWRNHVIGIGLGYMFNR
jgi:hypothetical protein